MTCPKNPPPPDGYAVWRNKAVPKPLVDWAVQLRDRWMPVHNFGDTTTLLYTDPVTGTAQVVLARKDYHTWTYHNGRLITNLCIPGITLYQSLLTPALSGVGETPLEAAATFDESIPDPTAARFSGDLGTDWGVVGATAAAAAAVVLAFWAGLHFAGRT
jgi:hypothetical protein